jgi:ABC-type amino acid transport substrate-binding protein
LRRFFLSLGLVVSIMPGWSESRSLPSLEQQVPVRLQTLDRQVARWPGLLIFEDGQLRGLFRQVLDCTFDQIPYRVEYSDGPFVRIQRNLASGRSDGFFPANWDMARNAYAYPSDYLVEDSKVSYRPRPNEPLRRVGVMSGANVEVEIGRALSVVMQGELHQVAGYHQMVKMLEGGRLDAIITSGIFLSSTMRSLGRQSTGIVRPILQSPFVVYFGKEFDARYPDFLPLFNRALRTCRQMPPELYGPLDYTKKAEPTESVRPSIEHSEKSIRLP